MTKPSPLRIDNLPLTQRARNVLKRARIRTTEQLAKALENGDLLMTVGCGKMVLEEVAKFARGLSNSEFQSHQIGIDDMPLSVRARNVLRGARIRTVGQLAQALANSHLISYKNCGLKTLAEIKEIARPYIEAMAEESSGAKVAPHRELPYASMLDKALTDEEAATAKQLQVWVLRLSKRAEEIRDMGLAAAGPEIAGPPGFRVQGHQACCFCRRMLLARMPQVLSGPKVQQALLEEKTSGQQSERRKGQRGAAGPKVEKCSPLGT